jgi:quercetin dioxygenase-like cupin family protein
MTDTDPYGDPVSPTGEPTEVPRRFSVDELPALQAAAGVVLHPLARAGVMLSFADFEPGREVPRHAHAEEQLLVMLQGELEIEFADENHVLQPGEGVVIPPWVPHRAIARSGPARALDVFCPPRQGILDQLDQLALRH